MIILSLTLIAGLIALFSFVIKAFKSENNKDMVNYSMIAALIGVLVTAISAQMWSELRSIELQPVHYHYGKPVEQMVSIPDILETAQLEIIVQNDEGDIMTAVVKLNSRTGVVEVVKLLHMGEL